jgi:probable rRNA maturation factor
MPTIVAKGGKISRMSPRIAGRQLRIWGNQMLDKLALSEVELSVVICDDPYIQALNRQHRGQDKPTDVLSFPQAEFVSPEVPRPGELLGLLGDVVISLPTAMRQAESRRRSFESEVRFLLAHGVLHLVGYDHMTPDDKRIMTNRVRQLVRASSIDE